MRSPYPLQWPPGMPRTTYRTHPKFGSHFSKDRDSVIWQLKKRGASQIVITSALPVRRDGLPYGGSERIVARAESLEWAEDFVKRNDLEGYSRWRRTTITGPDGFKVERRPS